MGNSSSLESSSSSSCPQPDPTVDATLYYFGGRGLADQVRWMLAATNVTFSQTLVSDRESFLKLCDCSFLPFQQIPVLQIDGHVLAQSQAIVRYLAKRGDIAGTNSIEAAQIDMIAEFINDMHGLLVDAVFVRIRDAEHWEEKEKVLRVKWNKCAHKLERILEYNNERRTGENAGESVVYFLVGGSLSYADVLASHLLTWAVEELGDAALKTLRTTPRLIDLQRYVITLPHMDEFIRSPLYYPLGNSDYVREVLVTLGRET